MANITVNASVRPVETAPYARGWDASYDANTSADYYVDASVSSSGAGTTVGTAFKTIGEAITQAATDAAARTIAIVGGTYRESLSLGSLAAGCRIKGYGTDKPIISAQEQLTGWTQCSAADATELGATLGVASSPIWKATVSNSSLAVDGSALNLYENGVAVPICQTMTDDKFFFTYDYAFPRADSFTLNGSNQITQITDSDVLTGITSAQATNAYVYLYHQPNIVSKVAITAISTDTIDVGGLKTVQGNTPTPDADNLRWNLANCLPKLTQGTYGWKDNGDSTSTIYVYPNDTANLTSNMYYAARTNVIDLGTVENIWLEGLQIIGAADSSDITAPGIKKSNNSTKTSGHTFRHLYVGKSLNSSGVGYGAVWLCYVDDVVVERCTVEYASGSRGIFINGGTGGGNDYSDNTAIRQCSASYCSLAPFSWYESTNIQLVRNDMYRTGKGGHTNLFNFYEQCDNILVLGNKSRECNGYATFQEASKLFILFNDIPASSKVDDNRALVDQTNTTAQPTIPSLNYVCNNLFAPDKDDVAGTGATLSAVDLGDHYVTSYGSATQPNNISFWFDNNVVHGGGVSEPYITPGGGETHWRDQVGYDDTHIERSREGNIYTATTYWQTGGYGWSANASETVETTIANVYTAAASGDFTAPVSSPILTASGVSLATALTAAEAAFPSFDFTKDADGYSYTRTAPKAGPYQSNYNTQVARSVT